jgi:hypothetical protein
MHTVSEVLDVFMEEFQSTGLSWRRMLPVAFHRGSDARIADATEKLDVISRGVALDDGSTERGRGFLSSGTGPPMFGDLAGLGASFILRSLPPSTVNFRGDRLQTCWHTGTRVRTQGVYSERVSSYGGRATLVSANG